MKLLRGLLALVLLAAAALSSGGCDGFHFGAKGGDKPKYDPVELLIMARVADLRSTEPDIWRQAMTALEGVGPRAVPKIVPLLAEENATIRSRAAELLGRMGPAAKDALPALLERVKLRNDRDMEAVLKAIGGIGPAAGEAVAPMVELVRDKSARKEHKRLAGKAIVKIGAPAVPRLIEALSDPDPGYRYGAARALAKIGGPAEPAREALGGLKNDPDQKVKFWARKALETLDRAKTEGATAQAPAGDGADDAEDGDETGEN